MIKKNKEKTLMGNAILNGIKQGSAILFPFISFVYCSRVLGEEGIGIYSFGQSIIAYFLLIAALGIPNYAIREGARIRDNQEKLMQFVNQIFSINCIMTLISYALLLLCLCFVNKFESYKIVIMIQSIQIILTTLGTDWVNSIFEDYAYLAIRYTAIQVIAIVCLLVFVKSENDLYVYTIITVLSNAGGNILNWFYLRKKYNIKVSFSLKIQWDKHIRPIMILFANSVAGIIYLNSDITMLGFLTNDGTVGIYTVSSKIYSLVKALINAIIMVAIPRFSYYISNNKEKDYQKTLSKLFNALMLVIVPCSIGMFIEAKKILQLVAGIQYIDGVNTVKILSVAMIFAVFACFYAYAVLIPHRLETGFLIATIVAAIVNIGLNFVFIPILGMNGAALTTLIAEILVCIISAIYSREKAKIKCTLRNVISVIIGGVGVIIVCILIDAIINNYILALVIEIILSIIVYFGLLCIIKNDLAIELIKKINHKNNIN